MNIRGTKLHQQIADYPVSKFKFKIIKKGSSNRGCVRICDVTYNVSTIFPCIQVNSVLIISRGVPAPLENNFLEAWAVTCASFLLNCCFCYSMLLWSIVITMLLLLVTQYERGCIFNFHVVFQLLINSVWLCDWLVDLQPKISKVVYQ